MKHDELDSTSTPGAAEARCAFPGCGAANSVPEPNTGCWLWLMGGCLGYGRIRMGGVQIGAHRISYEAFIGPIPDGLEIDHLCRVRSCVNPAHLEPVTQAVNTARGNSPTAIWARESRCKRGHPLAGDNIARNAGGRRLCRTCRNARDRRRMGAIRAQG